MSQFAFLQREWPAVCEAAGRAEAAVHADPRTACFYARRALELAVAWLYKYDPALKLPYQDNLSALIHEPSFKQTAGHSRWRKANWLICDAPTGPLRCHSGLSQLVTAPCHNLS